MVDGHEDIRPVAPRKRVQWLGQGVRRLSIAGILYLLPALARLSTIETTVNDVPRGSHLLTLA